MCVCSYHALGNAGQYLGYEFYQAPNLAQSLANSVFTDLEHIPDYRLKTIVRILSKLICLHNCQLISLSVGQGCGVC